MNVKRLIDALVQQTTVPLHRRGEANAGIVGLRRPGGVILMVRGTRTSLLPAQGTAPGREPDRPRDLPVGSCARAFT